MRLRLRNQTQWRPWFAWHPVLIGEEWVWWEYVERHEHYYCGTSNCRWVTEHRNAAQ